MLNNITITFKLPSWVVWSQTKAQTSTMDTPHPSSESGHCHGWTRWRATAWCRTTQSCSIYRPDPTARTRTRQISSRSWTLLFPPFHSPMWQTTPCWPHPLQKESPPSPGSSTTAWWHSGSRSPSCPRPPGAGGWTAWSGCPCAASGGCGSSPGGWRCTAPAPPPGTRGRWRASRRPGLVL